MNASRHFALLLFADFLLPVALGLSACGGRAVDGDPAGDVDKSGDAERSHDGTGEPNTEMDSTEDDSDSPQKPALQQLGECKGGHDPLSGSCPWIDYDFTLCFPTKEDACACLCPQDRDSVCVSGFYGGENGNTPVACN